MAHTDKRSTMPVTDSNSGSCGTDTANDKSSDGLSLGHSLTEHDIKVKDISESEIPSEPDRDSSGKDADATLKR